MNPFSPLCLFASGFFLGLPATILLVSWLGTLWNARIQLKTAMLFALASFHFFLSADSPGYSSPAKISPLLPSATISSRPFHLVMASRPRSRFLAHCFSVPNFLAAA